MSRTLVHSSFTSRSFPAAEGPIPDVFKPYVNEAVPQDIQHTPLRGYRRMHCTSETYIKPIFVRTNLIQ